MGQARGSRIELPASEQGFERKYVTTTGTTTTGLQTLFKYATGGDLQAEILHIDYDKPGNPRTMQGDTAYVTGSSYTPFGEAQQYSLLALDDLSTYAFQHRRYWYA
jgi:hypothetical protein